jgi:hypothetical protein
MKTLQAIQDLSSCSFTGEMGGEESFTCTLVKGYTGVLL